MKPNHFVLSSRQKTLDLSQPKVMGILNVTPDSFSDGGQFNSLDGALWHCEKMLNEGASIIDIGGESTRPNASVVSNQMELDRVVPVVTAIRQRFGDDLWLSLDTSNPIVMQAGVEAGADMINDVRALGREGAARMVASLDVPVVLMHSRGEPDTMNDLAVYDDVLTQICQELSQKINQALQAGISRHHMIVDIGMGFAKNYEHHQVIMKNLDQLVDYFGLPMLFGVSRKRFLGEILTRTQLKIFQDHRPVDRDLLGAGMSLLAVQAGAKIVRVHDVAKSVQILSMWQQIHENQSVI